MKKIALLLMCVAAIAMVSCGGNSNKKTGVKASETKTSGGYPFLRVDKKRVTCAVTLFVIRPRRWRRAS